MSEESDKITTIFGGVMMTVHRFDGTTERIKVRQAPVRICLEAFAAYEATKDEITLVETLLGQPVGHYEMQPSDGAAPAKATYIPGWSDGILPEDFDAVAKKLYELNRPTVAARMDRSMQEAATLSERMDSYLQKLATSPSGRLLLTQLLSSGKTSTPSPTDGASSESSSSSSVTPPAEPKKN